MYIIPSLRRLALLLLLPGLTGIIPSPRQAAVPPISFHGHMLAAAAQRIKSAGDTSTITVPDLPNLERLL